MKRTEFILGGVDFRGLQASQIMEADLHVAQPHHSWEQLANLMTHGGFGDVPVVDGTRTLLGVVTEYDLLKALKDRDPVREVNAGSMMTAAPITVSADATFGTIVDLLLTHHLIRVPVVEGGKLVGIVARRDIVFAFLQASRNPPRTL